MRGISSLIVIVLLLLIAASITGLLYQNMSGILFSATETGDESTAKLAKDVSALIFIDSLSNFEDYAEVYVRNSGKTEVTQITVLINDEIDEGSQFDTIEAGKIGIVRLSRKLEPGDEVKILSGVYSSSEKFGEGEADLKSDGALCSLGSECESGVCTGGFCGACSIPCGISPCDPDYCLGAYFYDYPASCSKPCVGGVCQPCNCVATQINHCTSGLQDCDETGTDCGGSCSACGSCVSGATQPCSDICSDTDICTGRIQTCVLDEWGPCSSGTCSACGTGTYCLGDHCVPLPSPEPVGHWKFDETSGAIAFDSSASMNNGACVNMEDTDWIGGKIGNALVFDGVNERVRIPNADNTDFGDENFSVSLWFRGGNQAGYGYLFSKNYDSASGVRWYGCAMLGSSEIAKNGMIRCYIGDGSVTVMPETTKRYNDSQWHHMVMRRDVRANAIKIFVDGLQEATIADTAGSLSNNTISPRNGFFVGVRSDLASLRWFSGTVDDVKIWDIALSDSDIYDEYESGKTPCTPSCAGKDCGADDGCGSPCQSGFCSSGTCIDGTCQSAADLNGPFIGLAGYPTSTYWLDQIINVMDDNNMNIYRMSANPEWFASKPHPYNPSFVQYFLDNTPSDWVIIVDRNHIYPPTETGAADFRTNLLTAKNSVLDVCSDWPNNPRVWIELGNEYVSTDFQTVFQGLIDDVRNAGCVNTLVIDKWNTYWSTAVFSDPQDAVYTGMHFYFNSWSVSGAITQMDYALSRNLKVVNTEIGADSYEASNFDSGEVAEVSDFMQQSLDKGISNTIWMNENLDNWNIYQNLGLVIPAT